MERAHAVEGSMERVIEYRTAVAAVAAAVERAVALKRPPADEFLDRSEAEVRRYAADSRGVHGWIFRDPCVLELSENLFEALDARPDGTRDWLHASLPSAVAAVARFDVMVAIGEMLADVDVEDVDADADDAPWKEKGEA